MINTQTSLGNCSGLECIGRILAWCTRCKLPTMFDSWWARSLCYNYQQCRRREDNLPVRSDPGTLRTFIALFTRIVERRIARAQPASPRRTRIALGDVHETASRRIAPDGAPIAHFEGGRAAPRAVPPWPTVLAHGHVVRVFDVTVFSRNAREALVPADDRLDIRGCCVLSEPPRRAALTLGRGPARVGVRPADVARQVESPGSRGARFAAGLTLLLGCFASGTRGTFDGCSLVCIPIGSSL